jgi:hypothetical protein
MRRALVSIATMLAIVLFLGLLASLTFNGGRTAIAKLAKEEGLCTTETCIEGTNELYVFFQSERATSKLMMDWCLGVDDMADTRVRSGGWLLDIFASVARTPCPDWLYETPDTAP